MNRKTIQFAEPLSLEHPVYGFGTNERYMIRVADNILDRTRAWALVHRIYVEKGYALPNSSGLWCGAFDTLPDTTMLLVERKGELVATLSLVFDSPLGLPADEIYGSELAALRSSGRRLCEIISLVSTAGSLLCGSEITKNMFKLAYLAAARLHGATDFLITVNPRHVHFYKQTLLMKTIGPERAYQKVRGAPAILLHLDLEKAEDRFLQRYGSAHGSFYRFFVNRRTEPAILKILATGGQAVRKDKAS